MTEIGEIERKGLGGTWLTLPESALEESNLEVGDWVLLESGDGRITLEKVETEEITIDIDTYLYELALSVRDREGYYTLEEALSNVVLDGLANLLEENGEENAERYRGSWILQTHKTLEDVPEEK